jgi:hypothetical protein
MPRAAWYVPGSTHPASATWLSSGDCGGRASDEQSRDSPEPKTACGKPSTGDGARGTAAPGAFQFASGVSSQAPGLHIAEASGIALCTVLAHGGTPSG